MAVLTERELQHLDAVGGEVLELTALAHEGGVGAGGSELAVGAEAEELAGFVVDVVEALLGGRLHVERVGQECEGVGRNLVDDLGDLALGVGVTPLVDASKRRVVERQAIALGVEEAGVVVDEGLMELRVVLVAVLAEPEGVGEEQRGRGIAARFAGAEEVGHREVVGVDGGEVGAGGVTHGVENRLTRGASGADRSHGQGAADAERRELNDLLLVRVGGQERSVVGVAEQRESEPEIAFGVCALHGVWLP